MRTIEEIQKHIDPQRLVSDDISTEDQAHASGLDSGMRIGLELVKQGKTVEEILQAAQERDREYESDGDDRGDAWESGYISALYWCAEQFDWDADGVPHYCDGNIWNIRAG